MAQRRAFAFHPLDLAYATPADCGPSLLLNAPLAPGWSAWAERLIPMVARVCSQLRRRERRARHVSVTIQLTNGQTYQRGLDLPRATDRSESVLPVALGLLRLFLAEHPTSIERIGVGLGQLVEGANQPIRFERYLARRRPQGLARVAGLVASLAGLGGLFALR